MAEKITYNSLLRDDKFLNDAYHSLRAQGINVSKKRKDIVDRFLTNKRYFDTNLASTIVMKLKKCLMLINNRTLEL